MGNKHRPTSGPLTPVQHQVIMGVVGGSTQRELAREIGVSEPYVSSELAMARRKMNCFTTVHAACTMATALAYISAAELLGKDASRLRADGDSEDAHIAYVLDGLARILRARADKLIPS